MPRPLRSPSRANKSRFNTSAAKISADAWAAKTLAEMTLDEKIGQLLMVVFHGEFTSTDTREFAELTRQIAENHVGGLMLGTRAGPTGIERGQGYATAALGNLLQSRAKIPLLLA